ncbi:MAG: GNAT family N-acetyltransferase [Candidatus Promineifilaceae bacterium]|nr:GNAT family N-acetyltransferase [Candidatus Promineifilaceae bacterium]
MVRIEAATAADADVLADLNRHVQGLHVDGAPHLFKRHVHDEVAAQFEEWLGEENVWAFIAYQGERPVGYVLALIRERPENPVTRAWRAFLIDQISVEPAWKGKGVGRALVEAALEVAREAAVDEVQATTWAFNEQAQAFFRALGFDVQVLRFGRPLDQ